MEPKMSALQRLQEKITQLKIDFENVKRENEQLRSELMNATGSQSEKEQQIEALRRELDEKDAEIEKIIAQVESLLS
jgi:predicted  nucleic acid-binding Zn-ribbon protein